jgi:hypothetical protein
MLNSDTSAIANEYPILQRYLGELRFAACLQGSMTQSLSWRRLVDELPEQLSQSARTTPEIAELARLERAMRKAFEASDALPDNCHMLHASVSLLTFAHNTASLWSALICGELPPRPYRLEVPQHLIIWRHKGNPRMRLLGEEEYHCMVALQPGRNQGPTTDFYIAGWLESNVVGGAAAAPAEK